jgi:D-alanine transaminase
MTTVYLNGDYVAKAHAVIPVEDRGFTFGDGIYEGVRAIRGRLFHWDAHAARMTHGLAGLRIAFDAAQVAALRGVCERLVRDNGLDDEAFLYLAVTRGVAPRAHAFPAAGTPPTVLITATRFVVPRELRERGGTAILHEDLRWARCDWKTLNILGSVLARQAAAEAGATEAILVRDGVVTEGAATTVFAVVAGVVRTHPPGHRILPGVTRDVVLACAHELGISVREQAMTVDELRGAHEIFLCGSTTDVTPVVRLDGASVGAGTPGPITTRLRAAFEARLYAHR